MHRSKALNKALKRNHYPLPVVEDVLPELAKARVFTVMDAKSGFWHVPLDAPSSFRWKTIPFGTSPAAEEFKRRLDNAFEGLDGVKPIFDDTPYLWHW